MTIVGEITMANVNVFPYGLAVFLILDLAVGFVIGWHVHAVHRAYRARIRERIAKSLASWQTHDVFLRMFGRGTIRLGMWCLLESFRRASVERKQAIVESWQRRGMPHRGLLIDIMQTDDPAVRQSAAVLLGIAHDPKTVKPLIELLRHSSLSVRETTAYTLGLIGHASAVEALRACWRATDVKHLPLRRAARWAMHRIDPKAAPGGDCAPPWLLLDHEIWVPRTYPLDASDIAD